MISFIITGFGPFGSVAENPTTILARCLVEYLREIESADCSSTRTIVIETSSAAAKEQIDTLYNDFTKEVEKCSDSLERNVFVLIHLGVNEGAHGFALESCAYNNASFSIPDQRGNLPWRQPIVNAAVDAKLVTLLDVESLVDRLNAGCSSHVATAADANKPSVTVSTDPGRFVCNYTYCYSLDKFQCSDQSEYKHICAGAPIVRCIFVHVPPFSVVPERDQLKFVATLIEAIKQQLSVTVEEIA